MKEDVKMARDNNEKKYIKYVFLFVAGIVVGMILRTVLKI